MKHALVFVEPLGGAHADDVVAGLNRASAFIRGRLGKEIEMKFTPNLRFVHDESFDAASDMTALLNRPEVRRDLED
jgi:ribosome-binding factor A